MVEFTTLQNHGCVGATRWVAALREISIEDASRATDPKGTGGKV